MEELFFELIRVSIGRQESLSYIPSEKQWNQLYAIAKKQSLLGICFVGFKKNYNNNYNRGLYYNWLGIAGMIQQANERLNKQCLDLQTTLASNSINSCILKGQGIALYYKNLSTLRQSGDIDLWIFGEIKNTIKKLRSLKIEIHNINIKHADACFYSDTQVEIHFVPSWFYNPFIQKKFKVWVEKEIPFQDNKMNGLTVPTDEFNKVYILLHIYRHLFDEGIGLRQLMDYYFLLQNGKDSNKEELRKQLSSFGLLKFAGAVMWIMQEVFGLQQTKMICEANKKEGVFLLKEIMYSGNFGQSIRGERIIHNNFISRGIQNTKKNTKYLLHYPSEVLWAPIWKIWHRCWRIKMGF